MRRVMGFVVAAAVAGAVGVPGVVTVTAGGGSVPNGPAPCCVI